ncbi:4'-phosphopantetheinyl transferase [Bacillus cereus]|uniref:4'-phosphopantetheinyl transferase n=1 Tax=Bacillus cereus TaxID=1396 RepID=A0A9X6Z9Z8_BACCE|nr:4'-phosphopantetheinyl transferase superfamily protein [Bacillus cereus]PFB31338.1 4'-phosphopantetheinyl transferase [Bacillus cereus]PFC11800.1 4'-phosphopantetheinyl transferase [Bacillus cereus]PFD22342.1 4'-phosphopantetheinyl transferase [Bacillus cereus]PFL61422.1 4'-phosphopantetheinyl transferase [Bacillus cereus]PGW63534.1 4'-phosphopantetheinyl transferase [Bacillus cereus]
MGTNSVIYALKLDFNIEQSQYNKLLTKLTHERQCRVKRFRGREDAIRCIFADVLAKYAVHKFSGCKVEEVEKRIGKNGKPILIFPKSVHFNVSHAGRWVVCIVDEEPVGIDIEGIQEIDLDIAKRFFTKDECDYIMQPIKISEQRKRFFQIWTMKECYVKATGEGLSKSLQSFSVCIDNLNVKIIQANSIEQYRKWQFEQCIIDKNYILSAASFKKTEKIIFLESSVFLRESIKIL